MKRNEDTETTARAWKARRRIAQAVREQRKYPNDDARRLNSNRAREFRRSSGGGAQMVQSLGLFSATTLVVGSMIGSGIFIVDCDIARLTDSPALFLAAWVVTGTMTIDLRAELWRARSDDAESRRTVCLPARVAGAAVGISLRLDALSGHPDGNDRGGVCGLRQIPWRVFPTVSSTHWLWHIAHVPAIPVGPMVLGNMEIGVNTANLAGIVVVVFVAAVNIRGVQFGAVLQNVFTVAKALSLAGLIVLGFTVGRNGAAFAANFGAHWSEFWRNASWHSLHPVQVGVQGPIAMVEPAWCSAVVQVGSLFSCDAWNNVTFTAGEIKNPRRNVPLSLATGQWGLC